MFQFKFIKEQYKTTNPLVELMLHSSPYLKENNNTLENQDPTTLVIMDEKEQNIVGGTYLTKRELEHLQEDIRRLLPTGNSNLPYVWECSNICFAPSTHLPFQPSSPETLFRHFYHCLYEGLVEFGKQKRVGFVVVKLRAEAYTPTKEFGSWPYIIQLLPVGVSDDIFYGILPLRGRFYESYQKHCKSFEKGS